MRGVAEQILVGVMIFISVATVAVAIATNRFDLLPTIALGIVTSTLSYAAYRFSREKLRLDLFDKRWEIYQQTLEYCSTVTQQGTLKARNDNEENIKKAILAAHSSFRGIGFHKTRALFGSEIHELFEKLNKSYSWLIAYSDRPSDMEDWPKLHSEHVMFAWQTIQSLPEVFRPYMYFGDIKNEQLKKGDVQ